MQVVSVYLQPFWCNSLLKCVSQPKITKNLLKPPILKVQDHLRSSMLTFLKSSLLVLVMISSMSVPICNHFHFRRANNGKITLFKRGAPISPFRSWGPLLPSGKKILSQNTKNPRLLYAENKSLYFTWIPIGIGSDRHQVRITIANTRYSYSYARFRA